jgi:hypothetical protein
LTERYYLAVIKEKKVGVHGFSIQLENEKDFMNIYYGTHPYDYPFAFDVRYCKQKYINKDFCLYATDTKEITSLWQFDTALDTSITGDFERDAPVISECCKKAVEMFAHFQAMSDDEYRDAQNRL